MKKLTCLQYCMNGMTDRIFDFACSTNGKHIIESVKDLVPKGEEMIEIFLISMNNYFMIEALMRIRGTPKNAHAVLELMISEEFAGLHDEITQAVSKNFSMLMARLSDKQRLKLEALFK